MPRIPIFTAERGPGVLQLPAVPAPARIITGFEQFKELGETLTTIDARLQKQQQDLDYIDGTGILDAGWAELKMKLEENPNYAGHELAFLQGARELSAKVRKRYATDTTVGKTLLAYEQKHLAKELINVRINSRKLLGQEQLGRVETELERLSREAAESKTPEERDQKMQLATDIIDRTQKRGFFGPDGPLEAAKKKIAFQHAMLEKNMDYLRRTDRSHLRELDRQGAFTQVDPVKRLKILEAARADEDHEEARRTRVFNQAKEIVTNDAYAKANQGLLSESELDDAVKGNNPFISAQTAAHIKERNDNPITGAGSLQIRTIMLDYHLKRMTLQQAREALRDLADETGQKNKLLDQAADELMTDERTERDIRAKELAVNINTARDAAKSQEKPKLPGIIGQMQKNKEEVEEAKDRLQLRKGVPLEKVLKGIKDRNEEQFRESSTVKVPQPTQDILDLTKDKTDYTPRQR